ncbi:MAG TPA: putative molybdenum carrier protein [Desulfatiglandales bacterium]|nr:putative molybdenum carrier protein [Desulfatiglandales bacterium]
MIKKIISGGQTGAEQAALDAAIQLQIPHGGWTTKGRLTEAGVLPDKYQLREMPTDSYPERTKQNVIDSDGTLIISHGPLTGGSQFTQNIAIKHDKPYLHIDLNETDSFDAAKQVYKWVTANKIETLNIDGAKASKDPYIYQAALHFMEIVLGMGMMDVSGPEPGQAEQIMPDTVDQAVDMLISEMKLREKTSIANMPEAQLIYIHLTLGNYIRNKFGLYSGNDALTQSCREILGKNKIQEDEASYIIIRELWRKLHDTHSLRIVK